MSVAVFKDSVSRLVTGDTASILRGLVTLENGVASPADQEKQGNRLETGVFAPRITSDSFSTVARGETVTLTLSVAGTDGTITSEALGIVLDGAVQIIGSSVGESDPLEDALAAQAANDAATAAHNAAVQAANLAQAAPPLAEAPVAESVVEAEAVASTDTGGSETAATVVPEDSTPEEELPVGGCQTVEIFDFDAAGNFIGIHLEHFHGTSWDII